jgi:hypothetical protein
MRVDTGRPTFEVADVRYEPMTVPELSPPEVFSYPVPGHDGFWRTLVRVTDVEDTLFRCEVPGWSSRARVVLARKIVPEPLRSALEPGLRFHVYATVGAQKLADLRFRSPWEWDGLTAAEQQARIDERMALLERERQAAEWKP